MSSRHDAVVVGAGPNGLSAAVRLAQEGLSVLLIEANDTIGGGTRSDELTLPGYVHDLCSAIHPMAAGSPFLRTLKLEEYGLEWIHPELPLAHPLDGGAAAVMHRSLDETAAALGPDGCAYRGLMSAISEEWDVIAAEVLRPLIHFPRRPMLLARFGVNAIQPATMLARRRFRFAEARALFAGLAAHSLLALEAPASSAIGLVLGAVGHAAGWPMPRGGSQSIADALARLFVSLGGTLETGRRIRRLEDLPDSDLTLLNVTARQLIQMAGAALPLRYLRRLRHYRFGPSVFKLDYALSEPVPWTAPDCHRAGTIHVGGTLEDIAASERAVSEGRHPEMPFVLAAEHSRFDSTRTPQGGHTLWAYCHVPYGSTLDMSEFIERQIERFAPGFKDCVVERHAMTSADLQKKNNNLIGGDINGGTASLQQMIARPVLSLDPYRTPIEGLYLCSASTPPGGGVHGMSGFHAAESALAYLRRK